ncbi:MAG TPA: hypothetical protein VG520_00140 [Candidatus Dormibacteraeota bacterium]|nr:hypothetical protein [Candidatus Dormibacteraeota bacterium]
MNLTIAELAELPLAAALLDGEDVVARTPEWRGAAPGAVGYRVRRNRLVVSGDDTHPMCVPVLDRLLDEMDFTAASLPRRQALRVTMLAASLRIVAGRQVSDTGSSADVLEHACAGIASRTALRVGVEEEGGRFAVLAPAVAALVLVQLASNAERHDNAASVTVRAADGSLTVSWQASPGSPGAVTARRRAERQRWGLGFARIAADSIGGVLYPPVRDVEGARSAVLEVGLNHLALPLALIRDGSVRKATRAWDEETGLRPGTTVAEDGRAGRCAAAALLSPGAIARVGGWSTRQGRHGAWVAIPPDGIVDRARDVLDGMVHERALWDGVPEPQRSRIVALAAILAAILGAELARVPGDTWNRRAQEVARAYGLTMPLPRFTGVGAVDPRVALFLAAEFGEALETEGDELLLRVAADRLDDPLLAVFLSPGDDSLKLG